MDGIILAKRKSSISFSIQSEKSPDSGFFACDLWKDCIMPSSQKQITEIKREKAWSQAKAIHTCIFIFIYILSSVVGD